MVKIATWNVNSIRARLENVTNWLDEARPDIVLLQETKCLEENFPAMEIRALGYEAAVCGQKSYNGVAILSRTPLEVHERSLPGNGGDTQARYVEASTETEAGPVTVASIYLPNGNPVGTEKFDYKLAWMERLKARARDLLTNERAIVLGGDFNVIPQEEDCHDPDAWREDALFQPQSRARFFEILNMGYVDAFRMLNPEPHAYTFWDYQGGAWQKDNGIRIDHLVLSPQAADLLVRSGIDRKPRSKEKASDHTPVWCELSA